MKLNNKGFAISSIMYIILVLAVILISLILVTLSSRKLILDKLKNEVLTTVYDAPNITYRQTIKELKNEVIAYMTTNSIDKESIKIENFDSSIDNEVLKKYKLSDKYLTAIKTKDSYDVYLGKESTISNTTQLPKNTIDIVDYKIYGNSYQETSVQGKNLFNINKFKTSTHIVNNNDGSLSVTPQYGSAGVSNKQTLSEFANLEVGKTYVLSAESTGDSKYIYLKSSDQSWYFGKSKTITQEDLDSVVYWYANGTDTTFTAVISNIQIELGTKATIYEEFTPNKPSIEYPSEVLSVGTISENLVDLSKSKTSVSTPHVNFNYDNLSGTLELTSTPTAYDYVSISDTDLGLEIGETYYYSADIIVSGKSTSNRTTVVFGLGNSVSGDYSYSFSGNGTKHVTGEFTYSGQDNTNLRMNFNYGSEEPAQVRFENIHLHTGYEFSVKTSGKNFFDGEIEIGRIDSDTGIDSALGYQEYYRSKNFIKIDSSIKNIVFSSDLNSRRITLCYYDENYNYLGNNYQNLIVDGDITFQTIPIIDNTKYIRFSIQTWNNPAIIENIPIQLEVGDTVTEYEPYVESKTTNIHLSEPLRKVDSYFDIVSYNKNNITRQINELVLTGDEDWIQSSNDNSSNQYYALKIGKYNMVVAHKGLLTHFKRMTISLNNTNIGGNITNSNTHNDARILIRPDLSIYATKGDWINFLKDQHNNGTPVKVNCVLNTPTQQNITLPRININEGASIIEFDTNLKPSSYEFTVVEKIIKI